MVERVTNAIDAVLELEWLRQGKPVGLRSPREAVAQWFGIDEGRLASIKGEVRSGTISDLSNRISVTVRDSESPDRPTIEIADTGIGIEPEEFSSTILSLNKSLKVNKMFLAGAFGQGGSTALSFSHFTLILSRRNTLGQGKPRPVGATIVRFNEGNFETDKNGKYEYLVDAATGHPLVLEDPDYVFGWWPS